MSPMSMNVHRANVLSEGRKNSKLQSSHSHKQEQSHLVYSISAGIQFIMNDTDSSNFSMIQSNKTELMVFIILLKLTLLFVYKWLMCA